MPQTDCLHMLEVETLCLRAFACEGPPLGSDRKYPSACPETAIASSWSAPQFNVLLRVRGLWSEWWKRWSASGVIL